MLIAHDVGAAHEAARAFAMIGLDRLRGYFTPEAIHTWASSGGRTERTPHVTVEQLERRGEDVALIDVRARSEYEAGHVPDAINIPLPELAERIDEVPTDAPVVVHCQGGGRSAIAAALLQARGRRNVSNLTGGFTAWADRQRVNTPATR